jgi:hypothetical protein
MIQSRLLIVNAVLKEILRVLMRFRENDPESTLCQRCVEEMRIRSLMQFRQNDPGVFNLFGSSMLTS